MHMCLGLAAENSLNKSWHTNHSFNNPCSRILKMKKCSICKIEKKLSEFSPKEYRCKSCNSERVKIKYNPEKQREKHLEYIRLNPSQYLPKTSINRILEKIEIITESGCWVFMGNLSNKGYGVIGNDAGEEKKLYSTHRKTFEYFIGEIPKGISVCHRCDVTSCCNPNHLFLGTHKQNMEDRKRKGRCAIADKNARSKITHKQAEMIIEYKKQGKNLKELSRQLPISYWQVCAIANGTRRTYLS